MSVQGCTDHEAHPDYEDGSVQTQAVRPRKFQSKLLTTPCIRSSTTALRNALNQERGLTCEMFQHCVHIKAMTHNQHNLNSNT